MKQINFDLYNSFLYKLTNCITLNVPPSEKYERKKMVGDRQVLKWILIKEVILISDCGGGE